MNEELCMALADCGSPEALIDVILKHHPQWAARVPIEELARDVGIADFRDLDSDSFEGALLTDDAKNTGVILIKQGARAERRRFTIGHELGHFLIRSHLGNRQCTKVDLQERRTKEPRQRQEAEANRFAAGMLMPRGRFLREMERLGDADVSHVRKLGGLFETSLEATANRYIDLTSDICAFVFSKDGTIRYIRPTFNFPTLSVSRNQPLPPRCASIQAAPDQLRVPSAWQEIDGSIWLQRAWGERSPQVLEQSMRQSNGYQLTLLFIAPKDAEGADEGAELEESWAVRFRGRR
jgi:Zn-dependent peptidase ImmA (M78 family)